MNWSDGATEDLASYCAFLGIGITSYDHNPPFKQLDRAVADVEDLAKALGSGAFTDHLVLPNPSSSEAREALQQWLEARRQLAPAGALVVVWAGHGIRDSDHRLLLVTRETSASPTGLDTMSPQNLAQFVAKSGARRILLVIDTCHSGEGVVAALAEADLAFKAKSFAPGTRPWVGVLASCLSYETAVDGLLAGRLTSLLLNGPSESEYRPEWSSQNVGVHGRDVIAALVREWPHGEQNLQVAQLWLEPDRPFMFPNPRFSASAPSRGVDYLVQSARGVAFKDELWYFTGRHRVLNQIVDWLAQDQAGLFVVTGPAGSGKSAILDRIALLSDPERRKEAVSNHAFDSDDPDPGVGAIDVNITASGKRLSELVAECLAQLGEVASTTVASLLERLNQRPQLTTILIDALDEAADGQALLIAQEFMLPLSSAAKLIVGTRNTPAYQGGEAPPQLLGALGREAVVVDLAQEADTAQEITTYVKRRLSNAPAWMNYRTRIAQAAKRTGELAMSDGGGFLFARVISSRLQQPHFSSTDQDSPAIEVTIGQAIDEDLESGPQLIRAGEVMVGAVRQILSAVAFAEGSGLPAGEVWPRVASALSPEGRNFGASDIRWVMDRYGQYIVEDGEDSQAVYRLYHSQLAQHLRSSLASPDGAIASSLLALDAEQTEAGTYPDRANPYLRRYLAWHAIKGGSESMAVYLQRADVNPIGYLPSLVRSLNDFSFRFGEVGHHEEALALIAEAVTISRRLVKIDASAYLGDLATSLNNSANRLGSLGRREEALRSAEEAVTNLRQLAEANPDVYRANLAGSLSNLANCLSSVGRREEAVVPAEESLRIHRRLANMDPDSYLPGLALSLNNLSNRLGDVGRRKEALAAIQEAVDIRRKLAETSPRTHLPNLADSLSNMSQRLYESGRTKDALNAIEEAVRTYRGLVEVNSSYEEDLAGSLNNLSNCLRGFEDRKEDALAAIQEAVKIRRALAERYPAAYLPKLAASLSNLSGRLGAVGRGEEALKTIQEAVGIHRTLANSDPRTYLPGLAVALNNLCGCCANLGLHEQAWAAIDESVKISTQRAMVNASAYLPRLLESLRNLELALERLGRGAEVPERYQSVITSLIGTPVAAAELLRQRARWFVRTDQSEVARMDLLRALEFASAAGRHDQIDAINRDIASLAEVDPPGL